jgi:hypothetical protein
MPRRPDNGDGDSRFALGRRVLDKAALVAKTSLALSTIERLEEAGLFPKSPSEKELSGISRLWCLSRV